MRLRRRSVIRPFGLRRSEVWAPSEGNRADAFHNVPPLAAASTLTVSGAAAPAALAQQQDGLVNVNIGNVNILRNVDLALAANVVANVCA